MMIMNVSSEFSGLVVKKFCSFHTTFFYHFKCVLLEFKKLLRFLQVYMLRYGSTVVQPVLLFVVR